MLGLEIVAKEEGNNRNLDEQSQLKDSQEESGYRSDRSLPSGVTAAIVIATVVATLFTFFTIFIVIKLIIIKQRKNKAAQHSSKYKEEFDYRTQNFNFATEEIKYEQTDCAICLCEFGAETDCRVINTCKHVFHSQ